MMKNMNDLANRTVTIERTFDAGIGLVWEAWTKPEYIARWWAPEGGEMKVLEHDFKVGGKWKYTMPMPNGSEFVSEGVYQEIVHHQKIVTTANFKPMTEGIELHINFAADGEQTRFTFNVVHPTEAYRKQQEAMGIYNGWGGAFERLATILST